MWGMPGVGPPEKTREQSPWGVIAPTLLSSMTVFRDSIHIGSMSPSRMIHLGPSCVMLARSRIAVENRPAPQRDTGCSSPHTAICWRTRGIGAPMKHIPSPSHSRKEPQGKVFPFHLTSHKLSSQHWCLTILPFPCGWMNDPEQFIAGHSLGVKVHSDWPPLQPLVRLVEGLQHLWRGNGAATGADPPGATTAFGSLCLQWGAWSPAPTWTVSGKAPDLPLQSQLLDRALWEPRPCQPALSCHPAGTTARTGSVVRACPRLLCLCLCSAHGCLGQPLSCASQTCSAARAQSGTHSA